MIRTQRHSRFVLMSLDEIRATRDIVLQTEETKSNFSGSGKTVYICEVVRPCDYQVEIFAHELAHVATPEDREHGEAWKAAFDRIFEEYNRIAQDLFGEGGEEPC